MKKTVVRKRPGQDGLHRVGVSEKTVARSIVNTALAQVGAKPLKPRNVAPKPKPIFDPAVFGQPLTNRQVHWLDSYFQGRGFRPEYLARDQVVCANCGKRGTFKRYHHRGRFCQYCKKSALIVETCQYIYWYPTHYTRYRLNCTTAQVDFQVETNQGRWGRGWATKLVGQARR